MIRHQNSGFFSKSVTFMIAVMFVALLVISITVMWRQSRLVTDQILVQDLQQLHKIFEQIQHDCRIIDFDHEKNFIDFLTVKSFVGSQVGAMNLAFAQNWHGPYVINTLTMQEQPYMVVHNKRGYYIVPGDGVMLSNGKIIGVDIKLTKDSDMEKLMQDPNALKSKYGILCYKLNIKQSRLREMIMQPESFVGTE